MLDLTCPYCCRRNNISEYKLLNNCVKLVFKCNRCEKRYITVVRSIDESTLDYEKEKSPEMIKWEERRKEIMSFYNAGVKQSELAKKYGVSKQRIYQIIREEKENG